METATFKALSAFAFKTDDTFASPFKNVLNRVCYQAGTGYAATNGGILVIYKDDVLANFEPRHEDSRLALPLGAIRWDAQLIAAQTAYGAIMPVQLRDPETTCEGVGIKGISRK